MTLLSLFSVEGSSCSPDSDFASCIPARANMKVITEILVECRAILLATISVNSAQIRMAHCLPYSSIIVTLLARKRMHAPNDCSEP
eukprot:scaffold1146_cov399-Prasinococcus_capsulatus_cf.AAC.47